jgi:phosphoserine phosphatase RsbU/P
VKPDPRRRKVSLALKLSLFVLIAIGLLRLVTMVLTYNSTRNIILKLAQENAGYLIQATANRLEENLVPVAVAPLNVAATLEKMSYTKEQIVQTLNDMVRTNDYIYGSAIAFEPGAFDPSQKYFAPYVHKTNGPNSPLELIYLAAPSYDYFQWEWYDAPRQINKPSWSEPYIDPAVHHLMATYSVPFYRDVAGKRTFQGVVTADLTMEKLVGLVSQIKLYHSGHAFLVSKKGTFLYHPSASIVQHESVFSVAGKFADPRIKDVGAAMIQGKQGFAVLDYYFNQQKSWMVGRNCISGK